MKIDLVKLRSLTKRYAAFLTILIISFTAISAAYYTSVPAYALGEEIVFEQLIDLFMASMGLATGSSSANSDAWGKVCDKLAENIVNDASTNTPYAYIKNYFNLGAESVTTMKNVVITHPQEITHLLWSNMTKAITDSWNSVYGAVSSLAVKSYTGDTSMYVTGDNTINTTRTYDDGHQITCVSSFNLVSGARYCFVINDGICVYSNKAFSYTDKGYIRRSGSTSWATYFDNGKMSAGINSYGYASAYVGIGSSFDNIETVFPQFATSALAEQYLVDGDKSAAKEGTDVIAWPLAIPAAIPSILDGAKVNSIPATLASDIAGAIAVDYPAGAIATDIPAEQTDEAKKDIAGVLAPALDIPSTWTDTNGAYEFDLTTLFPFCVPFDLVDIFKVFTDPQMEAPVLTVPIDWHWTNPWTNVTEGYQHTFTFDFAQFDTVAAVFRTLMIISYLIFLIILTRDIIRG